MYSQLDNDIARGKNQDMCNFCRTKRGNQFRQMGSTSIEYGTRDVFGTFEGHLQKVLSWKENPDEFIQELVGSRHQRYTTWCN